MSVVEPFLIDTKRSIGTKFFGANIAKVRERATTRMSTRTTTTRTMKTRTTTTRTTTRSDGCVG